MIPNHLKSNIILYITPFAVLKTIMRITSVKMQLDERKKDHNGRDRNSHLLKNLVESRHGKCLS